MAQLIETYQTLAEPRTAASDDWSAQEQLGHLTFWHESFARNVADLVAGRRPVPLKGKYVDLNRRSVEEMAGLTPAHLLERLRRAHQIIQRDILSPTLQLIPYRQGSRDYTPEEHLDIVHEHIQGHLKALAQARRADRSSHRRQDMATRKASRTQESPVPGDRVRASRPHTPGPDYGIPTSTKGLLPWQHVSDRMAAALHYWISTVGPDGHPHATPVDGVWLDDRLYFGGSPTTRRHRNLAANPAVCVHLESGSDVVILHGDAQALRAPEQALAVRLAEATAQKYGYGPKPEDYAASPGNTYVFSPRRVFAWKAFPKDVTRWQLP